MKKFLLSLILLISVVPAFAQDYFEEGKGEFYKKNYTVNYSQLIKVTWIQQLRVWC